MATHTAIKIILGILSFVSGLTSAYYWLKSSQVVTDPQWGRIEAHGAAPEWIHTLEPGEGGMSQAGWVSALLRASTEAAQLNKLGAAWAAITAILSAIQLIPF